MQLIKLCSNTKVATTAKRKRSAPHVRPLKLSGRYRRSDRCLGITIGGLTCGADRLPDYPKRKSR